MHWRTMVSGAGERLSSTFSSSSTLFVVHTGQLTHLGFSGHQLGCQTAGIACSCHYYQLLSAVLKLCIP